MLEELPELARRLKDFVRENPLKEPGYGPSDEAEERACFAALTGSLLADAAKASRWSFSFPVMNDGLSLAELRSFENRVNTAPLENINAPGLALGVGLARVVDFKMGRDNPTLERSPGRIWVTVEYSPLGWPELPDMAEADLNVLFDPSKYELPSDGPVESNPAPRYFL